ncbi:MAG: LamG domain-containing protein [Candidatus Sericytochromatia bacterium]
MLKKNFMLFGLLFLIACPNQNSNIKTNTSFSDNLTTYLSFNNSKVENEALNNIKILVEGTPKFTKDKNGKENSAYELTSNNNFIQVEQDINPNKFNQLTMMAWVKVSDFNPESDIKTIISNDDGDFDRTLVLDYRGENKGWSAFAGNCEVFGATLPNLNKWEFIAVSYDQDNKIVDLYINDKKFSKTNCSIGESIHKFFRIGSNPSYNQPLIGAIDEVRIYNKKLSESEINAIYKSY